jgi:long-chain acyl-CoA synthetase
MKRTAPNLSPYQCLGEALRDSIERWKDQVALIEADRDRENGRLTYTDFKRQALAIAYSLQQSRFEPDERAAIIMSNQSKWLIGAYAVFYCGGVLVPVDFKLSPSEQLPLLDHAKVKALIIEYPLWRTLAKTQGFKELYLPIVLVTEAPKGTDLLGASRWEESKELDEPRFVLRSRQDVACIVYSSGTGGRPKGCMLTHDNYLEQCQALMSWYPFWPGVRYLSILPTNHAIDFMVGFIGPFVCGATVVHLRTLRPEYLKNAFSRYTITYASVVPMVLKALESGLRTRFAQLPRHRRRLLNCLVFLNRLLTRGSPNVALSRRLLPQVHRAFGGCLEAIITGGAFVESSTLEFFYALGIPVANGYGLTEAGTAITVNDLKPFRSDTVGKPLPGVEIKLVNGNDQGIGEVATRGRMVMRGYLNDPELTAETIQDGWLMTGDLGRVDSNGHLHLFGRLKNMIVTEGGKNIYPEDIESVFHDLAVKEYCVFAVSFVWKRLDMMREQLMIVLRLEPGADPAPDLLDQLRVRNRRLPDFKRLSSYLIWEEDFPRTASMKIKREMLAQSIGQRLERDAALKGL